jgi:hypothetical protein
MKHRAVDDTTTVHDAYMAAWRARKNAESTRSAAHRSLGRAGREREQAWANLQNTGYVLGLGGYDIVKRQYASACSAHDTALKTFTQADEVYKAACAVYDAAADLYNVVDPEEAQND